MKRQQNLNYRSSSVPENKDKAKKKKRKDKKKSSSVGKKLQINLNNQIPEKINKDEVDTPNKDYDEYAFVPISVPMKNWRKKRPNNLMTHGLKPNLKSQTPSLSPLYQDRINASKKVRFIEMNKDLSWAREANNRSVTTSHHNNSLKLPKTSSFQKPLNLRKNVEDFPDKNENGKIMGAPRKSITSTNSSFQEWLTKCQIQNKRKSHNLSSLSTTFGRSKYSRKSKSPEVGYKLPSCLENE